MPRYYVPYNEVRALAKEKAERLQKLRERNPKHTADVDALVSGLRRKEEELRFLPMRAGKFDLTVVIDANTGDILRISSIKPWGDI
jgi:hypothetical protein